ncbi:MAG: hypothetical protein ACFFD1_00280 [Candidatus Thorarchaeota archaeon]
MSKLVKTSQDARLMVKDDENIEDEIDEEEGPDEFLLNVVCFTCPYLEQCGLGQEYNSISCIWLRDWLASSLTRYEEEYEYEEEEEDNE